MSSKKKKDISSSLKKKGFIETSRNHTFYYLYYKNKKTSIYTKLSHSINEYGDNLLAQIAKQLRLRKNELIELLDCPMKREDYINLLIKRKILLP